MANKLQRNPRNPNKCNFLKTTRCEFAVGYRLGRKEGKNPRRKALLLIEGSRSNGLRYIQTARRLGYQPITLAANPIQYDYLMAEYSKARLVDTEDFDAVRDECLNLAATYDIAGYIGFETRSESVNLTVAKLCRCFDRPGPNPVSVERCSDKFTQRQLLTQVRFHSVTNTIMRPKRIKRGLL